MSETVYYEKVAKGHRYVTAENSVDGRARIIKTPEGVIVYLPERGLEIDAEYDLAEPDKNRREILQLTKKAFDGPTSSWIAYEITSIPANAEELQIEKSKIDRFVEVFSRHECEFAEFLNEFSIIGALNGTSLGIIKAKSDSSKYQDELNRLCEEIFLNEIRKRPKKKHLNTGNSINTN